jgi:cysteine synthase
MRDLATRYFHMDSPSKPADMRAQHSVHDRQVQSCATGPKHHATLLYSPRLFIAGTGTGGTSQASIGEATYAA